MKTATKKKKNKRAGKCVAAAYEDFTGTFKDNARAGDIMLVHGWVESKALNASIKHAWLEFDSGYIWEPVHEVIITPEQAEKIFHMRAVKRYTYEQALMQSIKTGFVGGKFEF